jgi:hypothetical protein
VVSTTGTPKPKPQSFHSIEFARNTEKIGITSSARTSKD